MDSPLLKLSLSYLLTNPFIICVFTPSLASLTAYSTLCFIPPVTSSTLTCFVFNLDKSIFLESILGIRSASV